MTGSWSDRRVVLVSGALLWVLTAWPAWTVDLPPFQDLPNHLAAAWVQLHPDRFPDLMSNGFFKTNSAVFLFLHVMGKGVGLRTAAKLFITLTLGVSAFAYPYAMLRLGSRAQLLSARFVLLPFVHNWFVAMGMLDFALGVPLGLLTLVALDAHKREPTLLRGIVAAALGVLVWYTHAFVFILVCLLILLEALSTGARFELGAKVRAMVRMTIPMLPAVALTFVSVIDQLSTETEATSASQYRGVPAILYGLWGEWLWSMTKWTLPTLIPCAVVAYYGLRRVLREKPAFFSPFATVALAIACLCAPHLAFRWFYLGSRFFPFFWIALVLRMPSELPRWLGRALVAFAVVYSIGLGIEYRWVADDWKRVTAAEPAVSEHSRLLTLTFDMKGRRGDNTRPFTHVNALFLVDRDAMVPSLFAHSRSFPITYKDFPPKQFEQLTLEGFAGLTAKRDHFCHEVEPVVPRDCAAAYAEVWQRFWEDASNRFDQALLVDLSSDVRAQIPASFRVDYDRDDVMVVTLAR